MNAHVFYLVCAAAVFGWILPEFFFLLSPWAGQNMKRVPLAMNLLSIAGCVLLVLGLTS